MRFQIMTVVLIGLGIFKPVFAEVSYPIIVQLNESPKILVEDHLLQSTTLKLSERQVQALRSEVRRARFARPAIELLAAIANAQSGLEGADIRYEDENLVLGTLFFMVNQKGEQFIKAQAQVHQVLKGENKNLSRKAN